MGHNSFMNRAMKLWLACALLIGAGWIAVNGAVVVDVATNGAAVHLTNTTTMGYNAAAQPFIVTNSVPAVAMYYRITNDAPWLATAPTNGTASGHSVTASYSTASLEAGTAGATITVLGTNAPNTLRTTNTVAVTLVVRAGAKLGCDGTDRLAQMRQGHAPAAMSFGISNVSAGGVMTWTATTDVAWLSVNPGAGSNTGETDRVSMQFAVAGMGMGRYAGHITLHGVDALTGLAALQSPRTLAVGLEIRGTKELDFLGDGVVSDLTVYQESSGNWYILRLIDRASLVEWLGSPGYAPAPGDFDGDGLTDLGAYRAQSGAWYARQVTSDWIAVVGTWGGQGYRPVPGDYDGDGRTDFAVYQESGGMWHIQRSSDGGIVSGQFGGPSYFPQPGDYDGDWRSDVAVYDEAIGSWFIVTLDNLVIAWNLPWGGEGYVPVAADYNGDGLTDVGVYNESNGLWFMADAAGNVIGWWIWWGAPGFQAVAKDFNGDGAAEMAVYEVTTGKWYIRTVGGTVLEYGLVWGGPGYVPAP